MVENKQQFVRQMFEDIAPRYDFLNRLLSGGRDRVWRKRLVRLVDPHPGDRVLDLACGTGDVARQVKRVQPSCEIVGADPAVNMLNRASVKVPALLSVCCESEKLPFGDHTFQIVTIAFGVRNFSDLEQGLKEVYRVSARGGRLGILEFAMPRQGWLSRFYRWYLTQVLPRLGALFSRGYAYHYLPDSIEAFPAAQEFVAILEEIGFSQVAAVSYLRGAVWIYSASKP